MKVKRQNHRDIQFTVPPPMLCEIRYRKLKESGQTSCVLRLDVLRLLVRRYSLSFVSKVLAGKPQNTAFILRRLTLACVLLWHNNFLRHLLRVHFFSGCTVLVNCLSRRDYGLKLSTGNIL